MTHIRKYYEFINENEDIRLTYNQNHDPIDKIDQKYAQIIEYTNLKTGITKEDVNKLIKEAEFNNFYGVCVPPDMVDHAVYTLTDPSKLKVISVIDFPNGDDTISNKLLQANELISNGVNEIDMVMDYGLFKKAYLKGDKDLQKSLYEKIENEINIISNECHKNGVILKIIIETSELTIDQISKVCEIIVRTGADYIATSTGTKVKGYEIEKIKEIVRYSGEYVKVKVMGGVRSIEDLQKLYPYVDRIGTSKILK